MYELKSENYTCYFSGEIQISHSYNGYKKTKTIYGNVIREIVSTGVKLSVKIVKIDKINKEEFLKIFKHDNKKLTFTNIITGELFTDMFIDLEELSFKELRDADIDSLPVIYEADITLSSGG